MKRRRERTDKGGSSTGSFDSRGRVSSLFFSLFSLSSLYFVMEEEVNDDVVWKEQTSGSLTRSKARVLPFFFSWNVRFLKILENSTKSAILNLGELILFSRQTKANSARDLGSWRVDDKGR